MGIGQWSKIFVTHNSIFCREYGIQPGEYLIMYNTSTSELIVKEAYSSEVVYKRYARSLHDLIEILSFSVYKKADLETLSKLKRGGQSGSKVLHNHHIIPVHLWKDCLLVVRATRMRVIDMNSGENMMLLPSEFHTKNHTKDSKYSLTVRRYLKDRWNDLAEAGLDQDPDSIRETLLELIKALRENLEDLVRKGGYINDI